MAITKENQQIDNVVMREMERLQEKLRVMAWTTKRTDIPSFLQERCPKRPTMTAADIYNQLELEELVELFGDTGREHCTRQIRKRMRSLADRKILIAIKGSHLSNSYGLTEFSNISWIDWNMEVVN